MREIRALEIKIAILFLLVTSLVFLHMKAEKEKEQTSILPIIENVTQIEDNTIKVLEMSVQMNNLQAEQIAELTERVNRVEKVAQGSLELGQKARQTVGWDYLRRIK